MNVSELEDAFLSIDACASEPKRLYAAAVFSSVLWIRHCEPYMIVNKIEFWRIRRPLVLLDEFRIV